MIRHRIQILFTVQQSSYSSRSLVSMLEPIDLTQLLYGRRVSLGQVAKKEQPPTSSICSDRPSRANVRTSNGATGSFPCSMSRTLLEHLLWQHWLRSGLTARLTTLAAT